MIPQNKLQKYTRLEIILSKLEGSGAYIHEVAQVRTYLKNGVLRKQPDIEKLENWYLKGVKLLSQKYR